MISRLQSALASLRHLLAWWEAELATAFLPNRSFTLPSRNFAVAFFDGVSLRVVVDDYGQHETLGTLRDRSSGDARLRDGETLGAELQRRGLKLVLRIANDLGVQVVDSLPERARQEIVPILIHRLDRLTPWSPDTAVFDIVRFGPADGGKIEVVIVVVPRHIIARASAMLASHGLGADVTDLEIGNPMAAPTHDLGRLERLPRLPRPVLAVACLVLVAALTVGGFLSLGLAEQRTALGRVQNYAIALEGRLADLPALQARIQALDDVQYAANERQLTQPSSLVVLESLSRALPDDAWLERLILDKQRLTFSGHARNASQLPGLMEAVRVFKRARFVGPIERQSKTLDDGEEVELDRFSMELAVLPGRDIERDPSGLAKDTALLPK